jgi:hypothetical protein
MIPGAVALLGLWVHVRDGAVAETVAAVLPG